MHNIYTDVFCEYCSFGTVDVKVLKCFYMKCFMHIRLNEERCYSGEQRESNLCSITFSHTDRL